MADLPETSMLLSVLRNIRFSSAKDRISSVRCRSPLFRPALGCDLEVPTLQGRVNLKVPAGTQSGKIFRLTGKGIVALQGYGRGDQMVILKVEVPTKLNSRQRELLEEFAREGGEDIHPQGKGFFDKVKELFD